MWWWLSHTVEVLLEAGAHRRKTAKLRKEAEQYTIILYRFKTYLLTTLHPHTIKKHIQPLPAMLAQDG